MPNTKLYPVAGSGQGCVLCESLGLGGQFNVSSSAWLKKLGYTDFVFGCKAHSRDLSPAIRCAHQFHENMDWLVVDQLLPEHIDFLQRKKSLKVIWIPRRNAIPLGEQVRIWPKELSDRLFIQWPHFSQLEKWGWTWTDLLKQQEYLSHAFPYIQWQLPPGWDLFNPEISTALDLDPYPEIIHDHRDQNFVPQISVIVPTYNNLAPLRSTIEQLLTLKNKCSFEVLIADDGSQDGTKDWFEGLRRERELSHLSYLYMPRSSPRQMGKGGFRAGIARNVAAAFARGPILLFLDSDILISEEWLNALPELHADFDLIQATRLQLKESAPLHGLRSHSEISPNDTESVNETWDNFQQQNLPWEQWPNKWKYTSTFCLSLKRDHFYALGMFRRSFHKYGFEDTDLGYRAARAGLRFHRSAIAVYHFKHAVDRSEYRHNFQMKQKLLRNSAKVFFLNNPDLRILNALPQYL